MCRSEVSKIFQWCQVVLFIEGAKMLGDRSGCITCCYFELAVVLYHLFIIL